MYTFWSVLFLASAAPEPIYSTYTIPKGVCNTAHTTEMYVKAVPISHAPPAVYKQQWVLGFWMYQQQHTISSLLFDGKETHTWQDSWSLLAAMLDDSGKQYHGASNKHRPSTSPSYFRDDLRDSTQEQRIICLADGCLPPS